MTYLYVVWLFFSAFFFYFAYINWRQSAEGIRPFRFRDRSPYSGTEEVAPELHQANIDFVDDFNAYLESINKHNSSRQRAAAIGFFIAGVISMASLFVLLFG
ncbi:MAG: hypothetical protein KAV87_47540 [Desulfobacteraceae bacterium]|nr:hypothetical protein [Desulfobacteraceae bacterium]